MQIMRTKNPFYDKGLSTTTSNDNELTISSGDLSDLNLVKL